MLTEGTIIALSTAAGAAAIGVIRLSGPEAISTTEQLFRAKSKKNLQNQKSHTCLLYTSPSPRDLSTSRMPSSA